MNVSVDPVSTRNLHFVCLTIPSTYKPCLVSGIRFGPTEARFSELDLSVLSSPSNLGSFTVVDPVESPAGPRVPRLAGLRFPAVTLG